ncbi:TRAP transporter TatT component family protein [Luteitalea pratensis]|uniref:TRAP transporter TatT component family protein n=1 Tax=Luteitalea pratensis TaxID=1855912 RepID=UPI0012FF65D7|nr:TRAP transporter TatT component family protein [Luteitalea pratensis]
MLALCVDARLAAEVPASVDALYSRREDPVAARQAADQYLAHHRAAPQDFVGGWKLARASYFLGTQGPAAERRMWLETGLAAATDAVALNDARPEGHFWLAANMGALAESYGLRQGLKYRTRIKQALERVLAIDPRFMEGSADRALGRWYHKVPGLFGGSAAKAEQHLRKSLTYSPQSTVSLFFLGELYADQGRPAQAQRLYQEVLEAPIHREYVAEDKFYKAQARARLQTLAEKR